MIDSSGITTVSANDSHITDSVTTRRSGGASIGIGSDITIDGNVVGRDKIVTNVVQVLSQTAPGDIQKIAGSQIQLLNSFYTSVLEQANRSFVSALVAAIFGSLFFLAAIAFLLATNNPNLALVSTISGALIEVISGINFGLYGKATTQLANFHLRLDQTQHFLLANSICEALQGEVQQKTRSDLVMTIATSSLLPAKTTAGDSQVGTK